VLSAVGPLVAQATWVVPNGADLAPYIAQAAPGDTLLLGAIHPLFSLQKGLTIRPASGRTTITLLGFNFACQIQVPAGQQAHLMELDFDSTSYWAWNGMNPVTAAGLVGFEDCTFRASPSSSGGAAVTVASGAVTFRGCSIEGVQRSHGLIVQSGVCSLVDCTLSGSPGLPAGFTYHSPGYAAWVSGGVLYASHSTFTPGASALTSASTPIGPAPGLLVFAGRAVVANCTIRGGNYPLGAAVMPPYTGASAIDVRSGASASHARCTLLPGSGNPAGAPTIGNAVVDANLVGITSSGGLRLGTSWTVTATAGASGQLLGFAVWFDLAPTSLVPLVPEPAWGSPASALLVNLTVPGASVAVPYTVAIPNTSALVGTFLWTQAFQLELPRLRASAVAGGMLR